MPNKPNLVINAYLDVLRRSVEGCGAHKAHIAADAGIHPNSLNHISSRDETGAPRWAPALHTMRNLERMLIQDECVSDLVAMLNALPPYIREIKPR